MIILRTQLNWKPLNLQGTLNSRLHLKIIQTHAGQLPVITVLYKCSIESVTWYDKEGERSLINLVKLPMTFAG